jgi:hypothetical protein
MQQALRRGLPHEHILVVKCLQQWADRTLVLEEPQAVRRLSADSAVLLAREIMYPRVKKETLWSSVR